MDSCTMVLTVEGVELLFGDEDVGVVLSVKGTAAQLNRSQKALEMLLTNNVEPVDFTDRPSVVTVDPVLGLRMALFLSVAGQLTSKEKLQALFIECVRLSSDDAYYWFMLVTSPDDSERNLEVFRSLVF